MFRIPAETSTAFCSKRLILACKPSNVKALRWRSRMFQSALQKLTVDQPFYDHLVHNLLLSYELLIQKLLKQGDTSTALDFLRAALRLEIRGDHGSGCRVPP